MTLRTVRAALVALAFAAPAVAQAPADTKVDLTGKWAFAVVTDNGTGTPTVTFKQMGDSIAGHYSSQTLGEQDFKGAVKGNQLTFTMAVSMQGQAITLTYTAAIESKDSLKGTVDFGGYGGGTFTGTRQKP
jgi:hypothetical protein